MLGTKEEKIKELKRLFKNGDISDTQMEDLIYAVEEDEY